MQGVQSSYKTDRGVKGYAKTCVNIARASDDIARASGSNSCVGGAAGNIRAKFEQMAKQEEVGVLIL